MHLLEMKKLAQKKRKAYDREQTNKTTEKTRKPLFGVRQVTPINKADSFICITTLNLT